MYNIKKLFTKIKKSDDGIYYVQSNQSISYPSDGNDSCMRFEEDSFWFKHRNNIITEAVKMFNSQNFFLDVGGGNGFVSKRLQDEGFDIVLIEPGKAGAQNSYNRGIKNVIRSTLDEVGLEKESIYSIGLFDVLEHIEEDVHFLKKVNKYLKNDGYLYITIPSYNILWSQEDVDAGHYKRYTLSSIYKLLKDSGFNNEYSTYIFSILPIPIFLFRVLPEKIGLGLQFRKKEQNEHVLKKGIIQTITQWVWDFELRMVKSKKKIPFGGSCFLVCKKTSNKNADFISKNISTKEY